MINSRFLYTFFYTALFCICLSSCEWLTNKGEEPIARAFDKYLYGKDLKGAVPAGVHGNDSIAIVRSFIDQWQQEMVMQNRAEKNIVIDEAYIQEQLDNYRKSLIRFQYEQELVQQKLDTVITNQEIEDYYENNKENFQLKKPILKVSYIKLPADAPKVAIVKQLFLSKDIRDRDLLEKYCFKYSNAFSLADTSWHYIDELVKTLPIERLGTHNLETLNRVFQISENNTLYLLILRDSKFRDSLSPLAFERENIKNLLLNQRKLKLISEMEKAIFLEAQNNNELEVYNR